MAADIGDMSADGYPRKGASPARVAQNPNGTGFGI